jgi:hypothetical protein
MTCRDMVHSLLAELDDHNCWIIAEAAGHPGPYRMQHLLSRARCDDQGILDGAADWATGRLTGEQDADGGDAVLIVDETGDAKSSAVAVAVTRWKIEEDHQLGKQVARLDSGQVTTWTSWHRWAAISLLAYAFLAVAAAWQRARDRDAGAPGLVPVTIPELLRQLRGTVIPEPRRDPAAPRYLGAVAPPPPIPSPASPPTPVQVVEHLCAVVALTMRGWRPGCGTGRVIRGQGGCSGRIARRWGSG